MMGSQSRRSASSISSYASFGAPTRSDEGDIFTPVSPVYASREKQGVSTKKTAENNRSTSPAASKYTSKGASPIPRSNAQWTTPQSTAADRSDRLWTPWILSIPSLIGLIAVLIGILILLEVLNNRQRRHPFHLTASRDIFLWTYGPSLLFCIAAAYWSQIDYRVRQLIPWKSLSRGAAPAARSTLLDYITPWHLKQLFLESLRARHFAVFLSACGSIFFKVLIIFWTGPLLLRTSDIQDELVTKPVSFRVLEVCIGLPILATIGIIFTRPVRAVPKDPATLASLATIMARGMAFTASMQGLAALPWNDVQKNVSELRYHTEVSTTGSRRTFQIRVDIPDEETASGSASNHPSNSTPVSWWNPLPDFARLGILAATFGAIVSLEIWLQKSYRESGLSDAGSDHLQYEWAFWPGLIVVLVYCAHRMVDFTTRVLQPLEQLRRGPSPASETIYANYLGDFPPKAVWNAVRRKHWAVAATALGSTFAPLLFIVASGLYKAEVIPIIFSPTTRILDDFKVTNPPNVFSQETILAVGAALNSSGRFPQWTQDSFAFPRIGFLAPAHAPVGSLQLQLPALSTSLNCSPVPPSAVRVLTAPTVAGFPTQSAARTIAIPVPDGCGSPCNGTKACSNDMEYVFAPNAIGQENPFYGRMFPTKPSPLPAGWNDDCPHITVIYGRNDDQTGLLDDLTALNCYPSISFSNSLTKLSIPGFNITASSAIANSSRVVARGDAATLDLNILLSNATRSTPNADFDPAFAAALATLISQPLPILLNPNNTAAVISALSTAYARSYSQYLSTAARIPWTQNPSLATTTGTLTTAARPRIVQRAIPTRLLEAICALLCVTLILSTIFLDTRRVIPNNPCSIAVQASLIADSDALVRGLPPECEWWSEREVRRAGLWKGAMFEMGFRRIGSDRGGVEARVFGVDVAVAEGIR